MPALREVQTARGVVVKPAVLRDAQKARVATSLAEELPVRTSALRVPGQLPPRRARQAAMASRMETPARAARQESPWARGAVPRGMLAEAPSVRAPA